MTGIAAYDELGITDFPLDFSQNPGAAADPPPQPADALIVSDIHLGAQNCQAKAVTALFQQILDGRLPARRLIINGDVFDSIDFRRLKKSHWKVLSQIRHLSDKIQVVWIAGNHDGSAEIISHLLGVSVVEHYILTSAGRKFLIIHGHQFDDFINHHPLLTALADAAYWLLQKLDHSHHIARLAKRRSKIFLRCANKIQKGAQALAAHLACHAAVCGHTHHPAAIDPAPNSPAYYNSGSWTESPTTYLTLTDGQITLSSFTLTPAAPV